MDNNQTSINDLPLELFQAILLRVQAKDLSRIRFVSKLWFSLISDPNFVELHLRHSSGFAPSFFFTKNNEEARLVDLRALYTEDADTLDAATKDVLLPFGNKKEHDPFYFVFLGTHRGFLFLHRAPHFIILWNPVTGTCKQISYCHSIFKKDAILYGVAYDASNDDYLIIVAFKIGRIDCFSLRINSWIKIDAVIPISLRTMTYLHNPQGLFFNGAIHWLIIQDNYYEAILIFDVKERSFSKVPLPEKEHAGTSVDLVILGECLALYFLFLLKKTKIWVMKEYKVHSSWTPYEIHNHNKSIIPLALSSNGSDFIMLDTKGNKIYKYNLKGELLQCFQHYNVMHRGLAQRCTVYTESLATLPSKKTTWAKMRFWWCEFLRRIFSRKRSNNQRE